MRKGEEFSNAYSSVCAKCAASGSLKTRLFLIIYMPLPLSFVPQSHSCSQIPVNNQDKRTPCLKLNHNCSFADSYKRGVARLCFFPSARWTLPSSLPPWWSFWRLNEQTAPYRSIKYKFCRQNASKLDVVLPDVTLPDFYPCVLLKVLWETS